MRWLITVFQRRTIFKDAVVDKYNVHIYAPVLKHIINDCQAEIVLGTASLLGKDLLPRVAAMSGVGMASDCTVVTWADNSLEITRPIYAGKAYVTQRFSNKPPYIFSVRPNVFSVEKTLSPSNQVEIVENFSALPGSVKGELVEVTQADTKVADLTEADIIVSGGRSLKSADNFSILRSLAESMGATVGASRAAVDAGYASHDMQVGQTGKTVSPKLYMAFGISGAIQHLAGMRTSRVIVAINKDPEAPIFKRRIMVLLVIYSIMPRRLKNKSRSC